jgi:predicted nicotinamide N-methyase
MENHLRSGRGQNAAAADVSKAEFIRQNTNVMSPPLVPEIRLHLAHEAVPLWQKTEEELGEMGLAPPFWAFAWAGGQALARYVLDHSDLVGNLRVLDLATGSGLVAIAAVQAGSASIVATDIDAFATTAAEMNAGLNRVSLNIKLEDVLHQQPPLADVILVGDLFYEKTVAARCLTWLWQAQEQGAKVFIGDPGRSYLPKEQLEKLAEYNVPVTRDLEDAEIKKTAVWQLRA